jgi:hypothetical protein
MSKKYNPSKNQGIIPAVYIVGIELSNSGDLGEKNSDPHVINYSSTTTQYSSSKKYKTDVRSSTAMKVEINMCIKVKDPLSFASSYQAKNLKIAVVQSTSKKLTNRIKSAPTSLLPNIAMEEKRPGYEIKIISLTDLLPNQLSAHAGQNLMNRRETNGLDNSLRIPFSKELSSGAGSYYNIPIGTTFIVTEKDGGSSVKDLSYFCYAFYDPFTSFYENKLNRTRAANFSTSGLTKVLSMGQVSAENVIANGRTVKKTFYFKDKSGERWTGPVHQMLNGQWMKGKRHNSSPQAHLTKVNIDNIKIRDHRIADTLRSIDLSFIRKDRFMIKNGEKIDQARINKSQDLFKKKNSTISEIYLSRDKLNRCKFMFSVNIEEIIRKNTSFPNLLDIIKDANRRRYDRMIREAKITYLAISRDTVKKESYIGSAPGQQNISLADSENTQIIAESMDGDHRQGLLTTKTEGPRGDVYKSSDTIIKGTMGEVHGLSLNNSAGLRHFSGVDYDASNSLGGLYQYGVTIRVLDPVYNFLLERIEILNLIISGQAGGDGFEDYAREVNSNRKYHDEYLKRFRPSYLGVFNNKYVRGNSNLILNYVGSFVKIVFAMGGNTLRKRIDPLEVTRYLANMCSPNTGSPEGVLQVLEIMKDFRSSLVFLASSVKSYKKVRSTGTQATESSPNLGATRRTGEYEEKKTFKKLFDATIPSTVGLDYFNVSQSGGTNISTGLTVISRENFLERFSLETKKYFQNENSNITIVDYENNVINPGDRIQNTKFSYLAPSNILVQGTNGPKTISNLNRSVSSVSSGELNDALDSVLAYNRGKSISVSRASNSKEKEVSSQEQLLDLLSHSGVTIEDPSALNMQASEENKKDLFGKTARADDVNRGDSLFEEVDSSREESRAEFLKNIKNLTRCLSVSRETNMLSKENSLENFFIKNDKDTNRFTKKFIKAQNNKITGTNLRKTNSRVALQNPNSPLNSLPNQVKALLLSINKSTSVNKNSMFDPVKENLENSEDIFKNPENFGALWFSYKSLKRIQILKGYARTNPDFMADAIWQEVTEQDLSDSAATGALVVKLADYADDTTDSETERNMHAPTFDEFVLVDMGNGSGDPPGSYEVDTSTDFDSAIDGYLIERQNNSDIPDCPPGNEVKTEETSTFPTTNEADTTSVGIPQRAEGVNNKMIEIGGMSIPQLKTLLENSDVAYLLPDSLRDSQENGNKSNMEERDRTSTTGGGGGASVIADNTGQQTVTTSTGTAGNSTSGASGNNFGATGWTTSGSKTYGV